MPYPQIVLVTQRVLFTHVACILRLTRALKRLDAKLDTVIRRQSHECIVRATAYERRFAQNRRGRRLCLLSYIPRYGPNSFCGLTMGSLPARQ